MTARGEQLPWPLDDLSRADAQMLVCFRDARARQLGGGPPIDARLFVRARAVVDDSARAREAMGRLAEAGIPIAAHELPEVTQVAQV